MRCAGLLLALLFGGALHAQPAAPDATRPSASRAFVSLPPAPTSFVTDEAGLFVPEARDRVAARLAKLEKWASFVKVYVYTLRSVNGVPVTDAMQELYRRWKMRDREMYDGLATVFLFGAERQARVMLGQGAPPGLEGAMPDIGRDLSAVLAPGSEPPNEAALLRVIDRIQEGLRGPTTWLDSPPIPDDPGGSVYGNPPFEETQARSLVEAVERASKASPHPVVLVFNPAKGLNTPLERTNKLEKAWPSRILLGVFTQEMSVTMAIPDDVKDRFTDEEKRRIGNEVDRAMTKGTLVRTLARVTGEMGAIAAGHPPAPWIAWKHPFQTLAGGQDETPLPPPLALGIGIAALALAFWFLYALVTNPKVVITVIAIDLVEGLIGGALDSIGGGGGGGGGFSGGGGSFGGGGSTGSW
ncbi:MAG: TPM domain-containing protein [Thermoanaerobaculia bacterium]